MEIYSPKSKEPQNFRKNMLKEKCIGSDSIEKEPLKKFQKPKVKKPVATITKNSRVSFAGDTIIFEPKPKARTTVEQEEHRGYINRMLDFLKLKLIERMKVFFDYEDKYEEKSTGQYWRAGNE